VARSPVSRAPWNDAPDWLAAAFAAAAPDAAGDGPQAVVVSDGPHSAGYWEHHWLATHLDAPLARSHELEQDDRQLWLRPPGARTRRPIDVVYNPTSSDRLDSPLGQLLLAPLRAGTLVMADPLASTMYATAWSELTGRLVRYAAVRSTPVPNALTMRCTRRV
jgi:uncharacterized circularly permuted ATP-grasp superfamily protein